MAIQGVKGAPGTVYVIKGNIDPMTIGQQFAQTVSQAKYRQLQIAQEAAKAQYQSDLAVYQQKVKEGLATYQDELAIAQSAEKLRISQLEDLRKLERKTAEDLADLKMEKGTVRTAGTGGERTTTKLDPRQRELDRASTDKLESDRIISALDDRLKDPMIASNPTQKSKYETQREEQQKISNQLEEGINEIKRQDPTLVPYGGRTVTTTTKSGGGGGSAKVLTKEGKAARDAEIARLEKLLTETQSNILLKEGETTAMPEKPEFGEVPRFDYFGGTRAANQQIVQKPDASLVKSKYSPIKQAYDVGTYEGQRGYLLSQIADQPNDYKPADVAPVEVFQDEEPVFDQDPSIKPEVQPQVQPTPRPVNPNPGIMPTELAGSVNLPAYPKDQPLTSTLPYESARAILPQTDPFGNPVLPPQPPTTDYDAKRLEFETMGLSIDELAAPMPTKQGQKVTIDKTRQQKRDATAIDTISAGMDISKEEVDKKIKAETKSDTTQIVLQLYNPPRMMTKQKKNELFTNAYRELEVFYKDNPEKMKEAQELLVALHFMNE